MPAVGIPALLGSAVVGGIFFAFSSFVMKALARLPSADGIGAMQSINIVVLNRSFLGVFIGTAVLSLGAVGLASAGWGRPWAPFYLGAAISYLAGTFLVTGLGNVPLNNELAAVSATDPGARIVWDRYHYERALELAPTDTFIAANSASLAYKLGRLDEAVALLEYAVARDPVSSSAHHTLGLVYLWAGRLDEAIASFRTALSLSPGRIAAQFFIGAALLLKGEPDAALAAMQQESLEAFRLVGLPMAYHALSESAGSDDALAELIEKYERAAAYNIAYVLAFRGEADRSFEWLDKAVDYHDPGLSEIPVESLFTNLQHDPRWLPFLESIGRSPEQLAAIEFNVTVPE